MPDQVPAAPESAAPNLDTIFTDAAAQAAPDTQAAAPQQAQTAPEQATPAPSAASINSSLLARAQQAGLAVDGLGSDSDLATHLLDQFTALQPYAQLGRQYLSQPQPAAQQAAEPAQAPEDAFDIDQYFGQRWNVPKFEESWKRAIDNGLVAIDPETGLYAPAPGREALALPIVAGLNQAHLAQRDQVRSLFDGNPFRQMYDALLEPLSRALSQDFQQLSQQSVQKFEQDQFVADFERQNASWLYQNGQLTPLGQKFSQQVQALEKAGISDTKTAVELARQLVGPPAQPVAPQSTAPQPTKQEAFLERSRRLASAAAPASAPLQPGPDAPATMTASELDNIFVNAFRQRNAA